MEEQIKTPDEIQLSNEEISDAEFKTLVIKMLTEMVEYGNEIEGKVKAMKSEIKENVQGTNSDRKEPRTQINSLEQKEKITIQPEHNEETRIQKNEERLKSLWDNLKRSCIRIVGVPEREEQQEIENLFGQILKENFPNMMKKIDFQEVQEAQRVPKELGPGSTHEGTS